MTTGFLLYNAGTERYEVNGHELHCGNGLEVLVNGEWKETSIEMNKNGWYLVGFPDLLLHGLSARLKWG